MASSIPPLFSYLLSDDMKATVSLKGNFKWTIDFWAEGSELDLSFPQGRTSGKTIQGVRSFEQDSLIQVTEVFGSKDAEILTSTGKTNMGCLLWE